MSGVWAKAAFSGVALLATFGLGLSSAHRTFVWVKGEAAGGRTLDLRGPAAARPAGATTEVDVEGGAARLSILLPSGAKAADQVPATVELTDPAGVHQGRGTLHVEEAGEFLSGTLEASCGGYLLRGGLRVRTPAAGAAAPSSGVASMASNQ